MLGGVQNSAHEEDYGPTFIAALRAWRIVAQGPAKENQTTNHTTTHP